MTQNEWLLKWFKSGKTITFLQATREGICSLQSRISELKRKGYDIDGPMIVVKSRWGRKVRVKRYGLL